MDIKSIVPGPYQEIVPQIHEAFELVTAAVSPQAFGAFGDGTSHPITEDDITAHPEWVGLEMRQREVARVVGSIGASGAGDVEVIVTAAGMTGSPKTYAVAVANNDTGTQVAAKIATALNADGAFTALFSASNLDPLFGASDRVYVRRNIAARHDSTLNISIDNDTSTGLTASPVSELFEHGSYNVGDEWDMVAWQEMGFHCYGGPDAPHAVALSDTNKVWDAPPGTYLINRRIKWSALVGFRGRGTKFATSLNWTGNDPLQDMFYVDGFAYGEFGGLSFEAGSECRSLLRVDFSGVYSTLKFQNVSISDLTFHCNGLADYGWLVNHESTGSGQGDTIIMANVSEFGSRLAGGSMHGQNTLMVSIINGDSQVNQTHGIEIRGAQAQFDGKHFENQQPHPDMPNCNQAGQYRNNGWDVFVPATSLPGVSLKNVRSESPKLAWNVHIIENASAEGSGIPIRSNLTNYRFGYLVGNDEANGGGRAFVQVALSPEYTAITDWMRVDVTASSTTLLRALTDTFTPDEHNGNFVQVRYPNCYISGPGAYYEIIDHDTTDFTVEEIEFDPGDNPSDECLYTEFRIYELASASPDFPQSGASTPDWTQVSTSVYLSGEGDPSEGRPGMTIAEGDDVLEQGSMANIGALTGVTVGMFALVQDAGSGFGDNLDHFSEIVEIIDYRSVRLAEPAPRGVVNSPTRIGTVVDDGTCKWMHYEYFAIGQAGTINKATVYYGQVYNEGPVDIQNCTFKASADGALRDDWLNPRILRAAEFNRTILKNNTPSGIIQLEEVTGFDVGSLPITAQHADSMNGNPALVPLLQLKPEHRGPEAASQTWAVINGGIRLHAFTLAQIQAAVDQAAGSVHGTAVLEFTEWACSDVIPGTSPAEGGGPGGRVILIGGTLHAYGFTGGAAPSITGSGMFNVP